jgi:hypothetical protein
MRKERPHESPAIPISPGRLMTMITHLKNLIRSSVILFMAVAASGCRSKEASARQAAAQTAVGDAAPTAEEVGVYADFIDSFAKTKFKSLSRSTFPLNLSGIAKDAACLQGLDLESPAASGNTGHLLGTGAVRGKSIRLLNADEEFAALKEREADAASHSDEPRRDTAQLTSDPGILALSEIVFDKTHQFAVLKYVFLCGSRCNSGAILVLEKTGGTWVPKRPPCNGSIVLNAENPRS